MRKNEVLITIEESDHRLRGEMDITTGFEPVVGGSNPSGGTASLKLRSAQHNYPTIGGEDIIEISDSYLKRISTNGFKILATTDIEPEKLD